MHPDPRAHESAFDLAEHARRLANIVRAGVVAELDTAARRIRVRYDTDEAGAPIVSAPVPWVVARAGPDSTWWAPEVGEQVVLLSPSGELAEAFALPALYSDAHPAPSDDVDKRVSKHKDGARFEYDRASHRYSITLPEDGEMVVTVGSTVLRLDKGRIKGDAVAIRWNS